MIKKIKCRLLSFNQLLKVIIIFENVLVGGKVLNLELMVKIIILQDLESILDKFYKINLIILNNLKFMF